jgi:hypothetical protein
MGKNFKNEDFTIAARVAKMILPVFTQHLAERLASTLRSPRTKAAVREAFAFKLHGGTNQKLLHPTQRPSWVARPKQCFPCLYSFYLTPQLLVITIRLREKY